MIQNKVQVVIVLEMDDKTTGKARSRAHNWVKDIGNPRFMWSHKHSKFVLECDICAEQICHKCIYADRYGNTICLKCHSK